MPNVSKKFDRKLFEANDSKCRDAIRTILKDSPYAVQDNPHKMKVDMLIFKNGNHIGYLELESKKGWQEGDFKWEDINFPSRKEKNAKMDKPTLFVMFNHDFSQYLVVKDKVLLSSPLKEVSNIYVRSGELFFKVPKSQATFNNLTEELDKL